MLRTFLLAVIICCSSLRAEAPPPTIAAKLKRGVNLSHWWWQPSRDQQPETLIAPDDIRLIKAAGLTHVRVPIDPSLFITNGKLDQGNATRLLKSIKPLTDSGLAVVIDAHPTGTNAKRMLPAENIGGWEMETTLFWTAFAPALKSSDPTLVAVELLNEPNGLEDPKAWSAAQERLRAAVRSILPKHTIVLTGDDWGSIDGLTQLTPSTDRNVVYSFHFYEPHTFTHQGATWGSPMWKEIKDLRYPFDQANADAALTATTDTKVTGSIKAYARIKWDAPKIKTRIDKAKSWADEHRVTLYLGEFGAYKAGCDEKSRAAWTSDVRTAAESANIGWCAWDYTGGYAITEKQGKAPRTLSEPLARALGLAVPPTANTPKPPAPKPRKP